MAVNGRRKGNKAELDICRKLSAWWDDKDYTKTRAEDLPFRRSPLSGGWDRKRASGDIIKPKSCLLCFEIKKRQEWSWDTIIKGNSKKIYEYWKQASVASGGKEVPMLVFTKNNHPWYFALDLYTMENLRIKPIFQLELYTGMDIGFGYLECFFEEVSRKDRIVRRRKNK